MFYIKGCSYPYGNDLSNGLGEHMGSDWGAHSRGLTNSL